MNKKPRVRNHRGLTRTAIVEAAMALIEEEGAAKFTVRRLAAAMGCDPMTVLYHVKSKSELERAMAEAMYAMMLLPKPTAPWRERILSLAKQCRSVAMNYPETFKLFFQFRSNGVSYFKTAETVYQALEEAGVPAHRIVDVSFGIYASVLGLTMAEITGLMQPADPKELEAIDALPVSQFPTTHRLLPHYDSQSDGHALEMTLNMLLDSIEKNIRERRL